MNMNKLLISTFDMYSLNLLHLCLHLCKR